MRFEPLILILSVCLVVGSQASSAKEEAVDFDRLNVYLEMFDDKKENLLSLVGENVDRLAGGVGRAARILVELSKFSGRQCDDSLVSTLKKISSAGLKLTRWPAARHSRKLDKIIRSGLKKALRACQRFVATQIQETVAKDFPLERLVQVVGVKEDSGQLETTAAASLDDVRNYLWQLSHNDPKADYTNYSASRIIIFRNAFEYTFDKYLLSPCKQWTSKLGELFSSAYSIADIHMGQDSFAGYRFKKFRRLAWANEVCQLVLDMDDDDKSEMLDDAVINGDRLNLIIPDNSLIQQPKQTGDI